MKNEYIKIFSLLIAIFYVNILEVNYIRQANKRKTDVINNDEDYVRYLKDEDYTSYRTNKDDIKSIENCQNSDDNYFSYFVSGEEFKFNKYVDTRDSVINIFI